MVRLTRFLCGVSVLVLALHPGAGSAQTSRGDSVEARERAERAQSRFERDRRRRSPQLQGGWGGRCDEIVGRICLRLQSGGDWWPEPEPTRIVEGRARLLEVLADVAGRIPGDSWVRGQRVAYLLEAGETDRALEVSRSCTPEPSRDCGMLEGLVLHWTGRFPEAEAVFQGVLADLAPEEARRLRDPRLLLDRDGRSLLDRAASRDPSLWDDRVRRAWAFADPLYLVPGNDRWTEHMARHAVVGIREEAANPYALSWGDDLAQVLVRYGWEVGWERVERPSSDLSETGQALGHQHPESRAYLPPGRALDRLVETRWEDWNPGSRYLPRTGYAPPYAPVILPAEAELGRIPLGDTVAVVVHLSLPEDTSFHRAHGHGAPASGRRAPELSETEGDPETAGASETDVGELDAGPGRLSREIAGPVRGLFALDAGGALVAQAREEGLEGPLAVLLPAGDYLISAEVWAPDSARAGRHREGFRYEARPRDLPALSDLFVIPADREPATLEELVAAVRAGSEAVGARFRVAWSLFGFGFAEETLEYRLQIRRAPGGFLRRAGRFLGLVSDGEAVSLSWTEAAPARTGMTLRSTEIQLPTEMDEGEYRIRLEVRSRGRETMVVERRLLLGGGDGETPR